MMKHEFETLAGYEVSEQDYHDIIEPMYMATSLSKEDFVKCIDKKRFALETFAQIRHRMREYAQNLYDTCTHYTNYKTQEKLTETIGKYVARKYPYMDVSWQVSTRMKESCFYPTDVVIFARKDYRTLETIELRA